MIESGRQIGWRAALVAGLATALWAGPPRAAADEVVGRVTASRDANVEGAIADDQHLRLGEDGACSILLDEDAVVELCGEASVVFKRDPESNRRIVSLDGGELRIVVDPRDFEERIEIHTPAAIATLLGTIVHVAVDPDTGTTTISSAQSEVSVRSDEPGVRGSTVLAAGEQVKIEPGEAPPETARRLDPEELAALGGCLIDFHAAAADRDRRASGERATERIVDFDAASSGSLPGAAGSGRPDSPPGANPGDPLTGQEGVCVATDCEPHLDFDSERPPSPNALSEGLGL